jgi:hypothetical protein
VRRVQCSFCAAAVASFVTSIATASPLRDQAPGPNGTDPSSAWALYNTDTGSLHVRIDAIPAFHARAQLAPAETTGQIGRAGADDGPCRRVLEVLGRGAEAEHPAEWKAALVSK